MNDQAEGTGNTISADVAARLIKVTPRRLQQLVKDSWSPDSPIRGSCDVVIERWQAFTG